MRARDEADAFEKLVRSCRHAEEACIALGTFRSEGQWAQLAEMFRRNRELVTAVAQSKAAARMMQ